MCRSCFPTRSALVDKTPALSWRAKRANSHARFLWPALCRGAANETGSGPGYRCELQARESPLQPIDNGVPMRALQLVADRKLEIVDLPPPPTPGHGEVTLRIGAVALNHIDVWGWRGMAFAKRKMPLVVGAEASSFIEAVGPGVTGLNPGQLVSIYGARTCGICRPCREGRDNLCEHVGGVHGFHLDGFAQEKVNLRARLLVPAPPGVDEIGAPVAPVTFG